MSSWRFLIIHTCRAEVASDHMGSQAWRQLPHLLVKRAQTEPAAEAGGPLSLCKGQISSMWTYCTTVYFYMCVHLGAERQMKADHSNGSWRGEMNTRGTFLRRDKESAWTWLSAPCNHCYAPEIDQKGQPPLWVTHTHTHTQMAKDKKCIELKYTLWPEIVLAWAGLKREFLDFFT